MSDHAAIYQILQEMNGYAFAKVTRVQVNPEHTLGEDGTDKRVTHFFGFATEMGPSAKRKVQSIWFKKANLRPVIYLGPVVYNSQQVNTMSELPKRGQMLFGKTSETEKGLAYEWCILGALPLFNFVRMLKYGTRLSKISGRLYTDVTLQQRHPDDPDDALYALTRLLVTGDVQSFVNMFKPEGKRERHPVRKSGYTYDRLYTLPTSTDDPVHFVFFACVLARSPALYDRFVTLLGAQAASLRGDYNASLEKWSRGRLLKLIAA